MTAYLNYQFDDNPAFISTFDEAPLWSTAFGLLLLKHLELKPNLCVLDIGSGAGFPLLELAERLGSSSTCYGIDIWSNANSRAKQKIKDYGITNVEVIETAADSLSFEPGSIDLIVSNLGINNFDEPSRVFSECFRVLKPGGRLVITTNLNGHWKTFYDIFETTLQQSGHSDLIVKLQEQQQHRGTVNTIGGLFSDSGLTVVKRVEDKFDMKFLDGSAFLNHHFVKLGWLSSFRDIIPVEMQEAIFQQLESNLNAHAYKNGCLTLEVPMAYIEGQKI